MNEDSFGPSEVRAKANAMRLAAQCLYCGNNPTSHVLTRLKQRIDDFSQIFSIFERRLGPIVERASNLFSASLVPIFTSLGFIKFNDDVSHVLNRRSEVLWTEANRRGIKMRQMVIGGRFTDNYEVIFKDGRKIYFHSMPIPEDRGTTALDWLDNKLILKEKLLAAGIAVPKGAAFSKLKPMLKFFETLEKPVIVKPVSGSRGRHTTTFIYTEDQLKQAFKTGKQLSNKVVLEEHLVGSVYRGTIIGGKLIGVLRGDPPRITGNGKSTIAELIDTKNKNKPKGIKDFIISPLTEKFLGRNNMSLITILPKGKTIDLIEKIGVSYGGYSAEEFDICHPETKKILEAAGRLIDFPIIGFDFIISDITKSPATQKWGIIECNSLPFINLHHDPIGGTPINAAKHVWDLWEKDNS